MESMDLNTSEICRVCLQQYTLPDMFPLHSTAYGQLLSKCTQIDVSETDGFPSMICELCAKELIQTYSFLVKCKESDEKLRLTHKKGSSNIKESEFKTYEVKIKEEDTSYYDDNPSTENVNESSDEKKPCIDDLNSSRNRKESNPKFKKKVNKDKQTKGKTKSSALPFQCPVCGLITKSNSALITHSRRHKDEKPFKCTDCNNVFRYKGSLKAHIKRYHTEIGRTFTCETCGSHFYRKRDLVVHTRIHTKETPYSCSHCQRSFSQQTSLVRHIRIHTGEKPYNCNKCDKRFASKPSLNQHAMVHSEERKFTCSLCGVAVKSKDSLAKHEILHTEVKSHVCDQCGMAFFTKGNLKLHMNNVHSERSGSCIICNKHFSNLEDHMRKHTGETPFQCHICSRCFSHKGIFTAHVNKHENAEKFPCQIDGCSKKFPILKMLNFHILKYHKKQTPHKCPNCSKGFFRRCDLKKHLRTNHLDKINTSAEESGEIHVI